MTTKTYAEAQIERNKHLAALLKMVAEYKGPMITMEAEFKCQQPAVAMLALTVSDVMDRVTNLTLRGQIFKIVGIHAPSYTDVSDLDQKSSDAIAKLLKISNGSTFYVSGRTKAADGTMYYAQPHEATSFLLMVAAEKGDACKAKGVYNTELDILEVLALMHRFSGIDNPEYTVVYDAKNVYPGVVP